MLKSRETRFKKSVEDINKRLGRAENFLDSEIIGRHTKMERFRLGNTTEQHRSSLPTEVYRDKNTLVEVTVHRNSARNRNMGKSWAESLSDTDAQFSKPTKSSLSKSKKSPRKEKSGHVSPSNKDERNLQQLLTELRDILKVSGVDDINEFVNEFDRRQKNNVKNYKIKYDESKVTDLKTKVDYFKAETEKYKAEAEKYKLESARYKHEHGVVIKQANISKETVNNLETQV